MKRKLYTVLGVLLVLMFSVSVVMLTRTTDTEPKITSDNWTAHSSYYMRIYKKYGVDPPPAGYAYRMSDPGVLRLDENGKPILYKEGEAVFNIGIGIGFAPTYKQFQHYLHLIKIRDAARHAGDDNRADQHHAEILQLKADAQGEIPIVSSTQGVPTHLAEAAAKERSRRARKIMKQAYIDMGLGYMIDY